MNFKKLIAVFLSVSLCLNLCFSLSYAQDDGLTAAEFSNELQRFVTDYAPIADGKVDSYAPLNRLIVKNDSDEPLEDDYGALETLNGLDGLHILQYDNEADTDFAYESLLKDDIEYVEYDYYLSTAEIADTLKYCYCSGSEHSCECSSSYNYNTPYCMCKKYYPNNRLSWNSLSVDADNAFRYVGNLKIDYEPVVVAVFDTGLYAEHEFFNPDRIIFDENYTFSFNGTVYPSDEDYVGHGTHVAGIIHDNSMDNVKICPYRIFSEKDDSKILLYSVYSLALKTAIEADFNKDGKPDTDVINMSLCRPPFGEENNNSIEEEYEYQNKLISDIIDEAISKNIVIVASAGNDDRNADEYIPGQFSKVITVSATERDNTPDKSYSNYGSCVDIAAPGTDIYSPVPNVPGVNKPSEYQDLYVSKRGTSMSAPLVSAAAALLKSINPDITPAEVKRIIKETAYVPIGWERECGKNNYGTGIVNFLNMVKAEATEVKPTITIKNGKIVITAPEDSKARIYYTLDGTVPTIDNHIKYTQPFIATGMTADKIIAVCHENGKLIGEPVVFETTRRVNVDLYYKHVTNPMPKNLAVKAYWSSSNPEIAYVDSFGNITGKSVGTTNVIANCCDGTKIVYKVTVDYSLWQEILIKLFFGFLWYI